MITKPPIIARSAWGAVAPSGCSTYSGNLSDVYHRLTVHHDAVFTPQDISEEVGRATMRHHQTLHMQINGWCDLGYHYVIDPKGRIYSGRSLFSPGAHVENNNSGNLGVCLMGNFVQQTPTKAQVDSLVKLATWFCKELEISPNAIMGHRDYLATQCPGQHMYDLLKTVRSRVAAALKG